MSDATLNALEQDVEQARARFANDLAQLRSPATLSRFKDDLWAEARETKDEWVGKGKEAAKDAANSFVEDLKARAAANPAAVLAIGAGLAWRLFNRPPIATALVGVGLYGLFRATSSQRSLQPYMGLYDQDLRHRDDEVSVAKQATKLGAAAQQKVQDWSREAGDTARQVATQLADKAAPAAERAAAGLHDARDAVRDKVTEMQTKPHPSRRKPPKSCRTQSPRVMNAIPICLERRRLLSRPQWELPISGAPTITIPAEARKGQQTATQVSVR
jgi:hypothetical protein